MAEYTETKEWQTLDSDGHGMTIDIGVSSVCVYYTLTPPPPPPPPCYKCELAISADVAYWTTDYLRNARPCISARRYYSTRI